MAIFKRSYFVNASPKAVFNLVNDTEYYKHMLPYCLDSGVVELISDHEKEAFLVIGYMGFTYRLVTNNTLYPHHKIKVRSLAGDIDLIEGEWIFDQEGDGTNVSVVFEYQFTNAIVGKVFEVALEKMLSELIESFENHLERYYE